jgi:hypothetical protein
MQTSRGELASVRTLVCLTNSALYLMAEPNQDEIEDAAGLISAAGSELGKMLPSLLLRRRIETNREAHQAQYLGLLENMLHREGRGGG